MGTEHNGGDTTVSSHASGCYRLPVFETAHNAVLVLWQRRAALLRITWLPAAAYTILEVGNIYAPGALSWLCWALQLLPFVWFAVGVHRLVLTGPEDVSRTWSSRETRFAWLVIGVYLVVGIASVTLALGAAVLGVSAVGDGAVVQLVFVYLLLAPGMYLFARLALVFPAVALDTPADVNWAWDTSKGNGWRLTVVTALPLLAWLPMGNLLAWVGSELVVFIWTFVGFVVTAYEVALLSVSYRAFEAATPTDWARGSGAVEEPA